MLDPLDDGAPSEASTARAVALPGPIQHIRAVHRVPQLGERERARASHGPAPLRAGEPVGVTGLEALDGGGHAAVAVQPRPEAVEGVQVGHVDHLGAEAVAVRGEVVVEGVGLDVGGGDGVRLAHLVGLGALVVGLALLALVSRAGQVAVLRVLGVVQALLEALGVLRVARPGALGALHGLQDPLALGHQRPEEEAQQLPAGLALLPAPGRLEEVLPGLGVELGGLPRPTGSKLTCAWFTERAAAMVEAMFCCRGSASPPWWCGRRRGR